MTKFFLPLLFSLFIFACSRGNISKNSDLSISNTDVIVFWGNGCPHCENVKKFIKDKQLDAKIKIKLIEVWNNTQNQDFMVKTIKENCQAIDTSKSVPVPFGFFVKDKKCEIGDQPINSRLKSMIK